MQSPGTPSQHLWYTLATVIVLVALTLTNAANAQELSVEDFDWDTISPSKQLQWTTCYSVFQCSKFSVPLSYDDPDGEKAAIAVIKYPSSLDQTDEGYKGPILFNPGGPGISGVEQLLDLAPAFQAVIGDDFDYVSFDPRGVGRTKPSIEIFSSRQESLILQGKLSDTLNTSSSSLGSFVATAQIISRFAELRAKTNSEHVSTTEVARDMLGIINAYGRDKLQYWGISYGTVLGGTFAAMFPDKVERMILDGVTDAENYYSGLFNASLIDTDAVLTWFYDACVEAGPELCPIHESTSERIRQRVNNVLEGLKSAPIPFVDATSGTQGVVTYDVVKNQLFQMLYSPYSSGAPFAAAFAALEAGNPVPIWSSSSDAGIQQLLIGSCIPELNEIVVDAFITAVIGCSEALPVTDTLDDLKVYYDNLVKQSSFADVWNGRAGCSAWDIQAADKFQGAIAGNTSYPILFIGNTADPVTPLINARRASANFPGSVVLQQNSPGHVSLSATSACTANAVRNYFRDGTLPEAGTICEVEGSIFGSSASAGNLRTRQNSLVEASRLLQRSFKHKHKRGGLF